MVWPCVQLVADDSLVPKAIQFWSHSLFSHAGFRTRSAVLSGSKIIIDTNLRLL